MGDAYVYLIAADGPCKGMYKIGKAKDPNKRIKLLTKTPFSMSVMHTVKCNDAALAESRLHTFSREFRSNGEWFSFDDDQVKSICACTSQSDILELAPIPDGQKSPDTVTPVPVMLRIKPDLYAIVKELADKDRRSINSMVALLVEDRITHLSQQHEQRVGG